MTIKVESWRGIPKNYTGIVEYSNGAKEWYLKGKLHRTDGPAVEYSDGTKAWYLNGKHHRTDGPAVEYSDGTKQWYLKGKLHRIDGPAVEYPDGTKYWYVDGKYYTREEHFQCVAEHHPESIRKLIWNL